MFRWFAVLGIRFYQKFLSKRKGYNCAHGVLHQNGTCSSIILNIVKDNPLLKWKKLIVSQFDSCKQAKQTIDKEKEESDKKKKSCKEHLTCEGSECLANVASTCSPRKLNACDCSDLPCDIGSC